MELSLPLSLGFEIKCFVALVLATIPLVLVVSAAGSLGFERLERCASRLIVVYACFACVLLTNHLALAVADIFFGVWLGG